jgi:hypothetical protein
MKTGFVKANVNIPGNKYYKYHGLNRSCDIQPDPDPLIGFPISPPYGPEKYIEIKASAISGFQTDDTNYLVAHNKASATSFNYSIGQRKWAYNGRYYVYRVFIIFNTSTLTSSAKIESAKMQLVYAGSMIDRAFKLIIQNGQPVYPHNPISLSDYNYMYYSGDGGSLSSSSLNSPIWVLNDDGINWINTSGLTKLVIRSNYDISAGSPSGGENMTINPVYDYSKLKIYYRLPL